MSSVYAWLDNGLRRQGPIRPKSDWWIRFIPGPHTYTDSDGVEYMSCTRFVETMHEPFRREQRAIECASQAQGEYAGMTPTEIMRQWEDAADVGTRLHHLAELALRFGSDALGRSVTNDAYKQYIHIVKEIEQWKTDWHSAKWALTRSEIILWSRKYRLAGMFDICRILVGDGQMEYIIDDIKTWRKVTSERLAKCAQQISLGCLMGREMIPDATWSVGGVLLWENYYKLREESKLDYRPLAKKAASDTIAHELRLALKGRLYEVEQDREHTILC